MAGPHPLLHTGRGAQPQKADTNHKETNRKNYLTPAPAPLQLQDDAFYLAAAALQLHAQSRCTGRPPCWQPQDPAASGRERLFAARIATETDAECCCSPAPRTGSRPIPPLLLAA
jgi:hypothetical protein